MRSGALESLRQRELATVGERLSGELGKHFEPARIGERVEGVIARRVDLESGPQRLIERSRDFTLVPWRDVLERNVGQTASGNLSAAGNNWRLGGASSGPEMTSAGFRQIGRERCRERVCMYI